MKNETTVTITNISGSKSYTLNQVYKKFIKYFILGFIALFIGAFIAIFFFIGEMKNYEILKKRHQNLITQSYELEKKIETDKIELESMIRDKQQQLESITDKITDLETMIGIAPKEEEQESNDRLDVAKITAAERLFMLRFLPSDTPIEENGITSNFGWRRHPLKNSGKDFHPGIDLRASVGTPVYATADGIVKTSRLNTNIGYGKLLIIDHAYGFETLFGHLSKITVKVGDAVKKGDLVAYSGNTGYSSGPHLHYEIRYIGMTLDPINFIRWDLQNYDNIFKKEVKVKWESLLKGIKWQWTLMEQLLSQVEPSLMAKSKLDQNSILTGSSKE